MRFERLLKIIGPALFVYILSKINLGDLWLALKTADYSYLFVSLVFWILLLTVRHLKWKIVIDFFDPSVSFFRSFSIFLKGVFWGLVTPGKIGEFYRAKYLKDVSSLSLARALTTVIVDRLVDVLGTALISLTAVFVLIYSMQAKIPFLIIIFIILVLFLSVSIFIVKDKAKTILKFIFKIFLPQFLLKKSGSWLEDFFNDLRAIKFHLYIKSFVYDLITYLCTAFALYFLGLSLNLDVPWWYFYLVDPFVSLAVLLPVSVLGVGIREVSYVFLFSFFAIDLDQAVVFSLMVMFFNILTGVPGLILFFTPRSFLPFHNPKINLRDFLSVFFLKDAEEKILSFLKNYFQSNNVLLVKSGRQGLKLILENLNFGPEGEVIVPSFICKAVPEAVTRARLKPVFCPMKRGTFDMDIEAAKKLINSRTKAIILTHFFGIPANLEELLELTQKNHLFLIEDCAHAFGSRHRGGLAGTFGNASIFSFGVSKNIGALGGGFILCQNAELVRKISSQKQRKSYDFFRYLELFFITLFFNKYLYFLIGGLIEAYGRLRSEKVNDEEFLSSLSGLQAKVVWRKLSRYKEDAEKRNIAALFYYQQIRGMFSLPEIAKDDFAAYPYFPVFAGENVFLNLKAKGLPVERLDFLGDVKDYFLLPLYCSQKQSESIVREIKKNA